MKNAYQSKAARMTVFAVFLSALGLAACEADLPEPISGPAFTRATNGAWDSPVPACFKAALDAGFSRARALPESEALTVAIRSGNSGNWHGQVPDDAGRFWWASSGKLATTMLALQEVEAGRLSLDEDLATVLPLVPQGITLRHLLTHTSGLADFARLDLLAGQFGLVEREALLADALAQEPDFPFGEGWAYSNTGFLLVQKLLETVTGSSYETLVKTRLADPLGLTGFAAPRAVVPADLVLPALGTPIPASEFPPNIGGAGSVVATADEMARFWQAAMAGTYVDVARLQAAISTLFPFFGSEAMQMGAGIIVYPASDGSGYWLGHGGGADEVSAMVLYSPRRQMVIAVAGIGPEVRAMEIANIFIEIMDRCRAGTC